VDLINLIYVSSARAELGSEELAHVLESSVRRNTQQHVTGALLYLNGSFMQVLEGDEAAVDETYARILQDPLHTGLILIERAPIKARSFGSWGMGFKRLGAADVAAYPAYFPLFGEGFDATAIGAKKGFALAILTRFALNQGR
jgi:hypothetical protein